ncbi:pilus assembly protein PilO [Clostridium chromiireducens]|uniref:Pilus assembly protein PilO n=1 Tax=Clostridium chromiireducens TaxID=225345 RepID=A0A964W0X6_9CLOT|nr:pilus assembly protein PilO [Clostridium chromiireducens]MVX62575.1 pilus assembly protein PilO [Clostridium chromiireducens]
MKISNKEKIMLCILGIIIIGFGYYQLVYCVQINKIEEKTKQENEIEQKYNTTMETIKSIEDKKSDVKILKAKISEESSPFYPTISEEHIIIELDKLLKDSGLDGGITFQPIVSDSVENSKREEKSLAESSLQGIVDQYNNIVENTEDTSSNKTVDNSTNSKDSNKTSETSTANNSKADNSNSSNKKDSKDNKKNTVQYLKCEVKFQGSYENVDKLLSIISESKKKIVVNSISVSQDTLNLIKGTIKLEIYSIPKIDDELERYLKWDLTNTYGKSVPFNKGAAGGNVEINKDTNDFIASVKSIYSDLPTIMLGKANDSLRTSYVYADSNAEENVEMILTQDGNKYYYKYKTSKGTFPANYDGLGAEFVPLSKNIVLNISSKNREDANDNSEIKLKIINKTDKLAEVNISGDDSIDPRVVIDGDGSNISVNKK